MSDTLQAPEQLYDLKACDEFLAAIEAKLGAGSIAVDLKECRALSSYGLKALVQASDKLKESGGKLTLKNLRPEVKELCAPLFIDKLFELE